jgi:hypothetical protein
VPERRRKRSNKKEEVGERNTCRADDLRSDTISTYASLLPKPILSLDPVPNKPSILSAARGTRLRRTRHVLREDKERTRRGQGEEKERKRRGKGKEMERRER